MPVWLEQVGKGGEGKRGCQGRTGNRSWKLRPAPPLGPPPSPLLGSQGLTVEWLSGRCPQPRGAVSSKSCASVGTSLTGQMGETKAIDLASTLGQLRGAIWLQRFLWGVEATAGDYITAKLPLPVPFPHSSVGVYPRFPPQVEGSVRLLLL